MRKIELKNMHTDLAAIRGEVLSHHLRQWLVWKTNIVEFAIDCKCAHIGLQVKLVGMSAALSMKLNVKARGLAQSLSLVETK